MKTKISNFRAATIIARAQSDGSSATTYRGAAKYCIAHKLTHEPKSTLHQSDRLAMWQSGRMLDRAFRGATTPDLKLSDGRVGARGYRFAALADDAQAAIARDEISRKNPRKKNLYLGQAQIGGPAAQERWEKINYKGKFSGYTGSNLYCNYQSCIGLTVSGKSAVVIIGQKFVRRILAPAGLLFRKDSNGVFLERQSDMMDYHPTTEDWHARDFVARCRAQLAKNFAARVEARKIEREVQRTQKIYAREIGSVRVTLDDSRRAGNCVSGTLAWCERKLGLSRQEILDGGYLFSRSAARILAAHGDQPGVERAVKAAWARETTVMI